MSRTDGIGPRPVYMNNCIEVGIARVETDLGERNESLASGGEEVLHMLLTTVEKLQTGLICEGTLCTDRIELVVRGRRKGSLSHGHLLGGESAFRLLLI